MPDGGWADFDRDKYKCDACDGQGVVMKVRQLGPGMIQQVQMACDACGGSGYNVKMKKERKILEVAINKGMRNGSKIKFQGESNQQPGCIPGDVVFVLKQKDHETFTRKGPHLYLNKSVSLRDALCGTSFQLVHLDGRKLQISTKPGEILSSESIKMVENEGMPKEDNPFIKGYLVVQFQIVFPQNGSLSEKAVSTLSHVLPRGEDLCDIFDPSEPDVEEEGGGGGRRVQCAQG